MKLGFAPFVCALVLAVGAGLMTAQASPADDIPGTMTPPTTITAAPVPPMSAAEASRTTPPASATVPAPAGATEAQAPAGATSTAGATASAAAAPGSAAAPATDAELESIRKTARVLGLKPRNKAGSEVYCKSFAELGTRMATLNCYTKEQVVELHKRIQSNQDDIASMQRASLTEPNGG